MQKKIFTHRRGFTLVEMLMVITIIGILMMVGMFPYAEYMRRAALSTSVDTITQEWILAHKEVRNGILYDGAKSSEGDETHGYILIEFVKNSDTIREYLLDTDDLNTGIATKKLLKTITLDYHVTLQDFFAKVPISDTDTIRYLIKPPYGHGIFYDKNNREIEISELTLTIGYAGGTPENGMAKNILLRPYLQ